MSKKGTVHKILNKTFKSKSKKVRKWSWGITIGFVIIFFGILVPETTESPTTHSPDVTITKASTQSAEAQIKEDLEKYTSISNADVKIIGNTLTSDVTLKVGTSSMLLNIRLLALGCLAAPMNTSADIETVTCNIYSSSYEKFGSYKTTLSNIKASYGDVEYLKSKFWPNVEITEKTVPTAELKLDQLTCRTGKYGWAEILGTVTNSGSATAYYVQVDIDLYKGNTLVESDWTFVKGSEPNIPPGATRTFDETIIDPQPWDNCKARVSSS